jgi:hypothetical protein
LLELIGTIDQDSDYYKIAYKYIQYFADRCGRFTMEQLFSEAKQKSFYFQLRNGKIQGRHRSTKGLPVRPTTEHVKGGII